MAMALAAFGAATLLPFQSELVFVPIQLAGSLPLPILLLVASAFNTAGSALNYLIGRGLMRFRDRRWFPASAAQLARAEAWYARWGVWSLLLSWAPLGDAITVVAGMMRTPAWLFLLLVGIAKTLRYLVLAWASCELAG
ncbi:DedA family protein [Pseudooceanicola sp. CBS1P-1]|uniref:DedA family protein n=2 Tax=Paracoccaceae TaxID=31989 RepID=A0A6L7FZ38_9RHOB|nr:DedA family protein [Pseudooceanicola endophyticus]MXN16546.1 DedA family protein [Pseudooceanicola albus]